MATDHTTHTTCLMPATIATLVALLTLAGCAPDYETVYTVRGVQVLCEDDGACPEPDDMQAMIDRESTRFAPYFYKFQPSERLARYEPVWIVTVDPPRYGGRDRCGITYPRNYTETWHACTLDDGGGAYEYRLHLLDLLFPGRDEAADVQWMQDESITSP